MQLSPKWSRKKKVLATFLKVCHCFKNCFKSSVCKAHFEIRYKIPSSRRYKTCIHGSYNQAKKLRQVHIYIPGKIKSSQESNLTENSSTLAALLPCHISQHVLSKVIPLLKMIALPRSNLLAILDL